MTPRPLVLLVDEDADTRNILRTVLEYSGYDVAEADGVRGGVRRAREQRPALVFAALEMTSLSGFELLSLLQLEPTLREIPVIAVSASDLEREATASGFRGYVTKPLSLPQVLATLHAVLPLHAG